MDLTTRIKLATRAVDRAREALEDARAHLSDLQRRQARRESPRSVAIGGTGCENPGAYARSRDARPQTASVPMVLTADDLEALPHGSLIYDSRGNILTKLISGWTPITSSIPVRVQPPALVLKSNTWSWSFNYVTGSVIPD